jgi:hypothetical protein
MLSQTNKETIVRLSRDDASSTLLPLRTPITEGVVDPVSQIGVGGKDGIQFPLADRFRVDLWPSSASTPTQE